MFRQLAIITGLLLSVVATAAAKPLILVVQQQVQEFTERDPNLVLLPVLASALAETGWVSTTIWVESNPLLTAAIADGELKVFSNTPRNEDVMLVARAIRADYVAYCTARAVGGSVRGTIEVFRVSGGRSIFKDEAAVQILVDGALDRPSSMLSLANTFTVKLFAGPLKDLASAAPIETPPATGSTVSQTVSLPVDKAPFENGIKALDGGRVLEAIALLRDAVDADPTDAQARIALIDALRRAGRPYLAADEAMRGAELNPTDLSLVVAAADSWLAGGQPEKARALARLVIDASPSSDAAWIVFGDVCLSSVQYDDAISAYTKAIDLKPSADAYYKRAQAYALTENYQASSRDLSLAKDLGLDDDPVRAESRYRATMRVIDNVFTSLATSIRNLLVEAKTTSGPDLNRRAAEAVSRLASFNEYVGQLTPPNSHTRSHEQRVLALSLLLQSGLGMQKFILQSNPETGDEANLLQIEAMREYGAGRTIFERESTKRE